MGTALNMLLVVWFVVMLSRLGAGFQISEDWMDVGQSNIIETYALPEPETKKLFKIYDLTPPKNSVLKPIQNSSKKKIGAQDGSADVHGNDYKNGSDKKDVANAYRIIRLTSSDTNNSSEIHKNISDDEHSNEMEKMNVHAVQANELQKTRADETYRTKPIIGPLNAPYKKNGYTAHGDPYKLIENGPHAPEADHNYDNAIINVGVVARHRTAHSPLHSQGLLVPVPKSTYLIQGPTPYRPPYMPAYPPGYQARILTGKKQNMMSNLNAESVGNMYSELIHQAPSEISKVYAEDIYDEENDDNVIVIHEHHHHHHHKNVTEDGMDETDDEYLLVPNKFMPRNDKFVADKHSYLNDESEHIETPDVFNEGVLDHFLTEFFQPEHIGPGTGYKDYSKEDEHEDLYQNLYSHLYSEYLRRNGYDDYKEVAKEDIEEFVEDGFTPILEIELD